jgi:integrase
LVKSAIASVVDPTTGEQVHSRAWNTKFLDVPEVKNQRQPTVTATELENAIAAAFETGHMLDGVLWALAAGSGARIGELRALRVGPSEVSSCWNPEDSLLTIRTSMWRGFEQAPKTEAAHRTIEIAGNLNELLKSFVASRSAKPGDFLFASSTGRATDVTTLRSRLDEYLPGRGFHAMRRFYITHKRQCGMSEQVLKALVGHASSDITDRYSRITSERRRAEVERCGLGFTLPVHSA